VNAINHTLSDGRVIVVLSDLSTEPFKNHFRSYHSHDVTTEYTHHICTPDCIKLATHGAKCFLSPRVSMQRGHVSKEDPLGEVVPETPPFLLPKSGRRRSTPVEITMNRPSLAFVTAGFASLGVC